METATRRGADRPAPPEPLRGERGASVRSASVQPARLGAVGASGYLVNLAAYATLVHGAGVHFLVAAVCSFLVAVANDCCWNRVWTFRSRAPAGRQTARFLAVSLAGLGLNLALLALFVAAGLGKLPAQAAALGVVAPLSFLGKRLWSFGAAKVRLREPLGAGARRLLAAVEREPMLVPILAVYVFALARLAPNELVQDSWLTLVSGREVAGGLPSVDTLTVLGEGARWIDQQWLAHLAFYGTFLGGGITAVILLHVGLLGTAYALALAGARRLGASSRNVFCVAVGAFFLAPWTWQLRAQSFAYVLFVAVLWLLARDSRAPSRRVFLVVPLLVLWANLHGSVVLGAALVGLRGLAVTAGELRARRRPGLRAGALLLLPAACVLVSPYGLSLAGYYRDMLVAPEFARIVGEWRPPTFQQAWPFFLLALVAVWLVARAGRRLTGFEKLALLTTVVLGFLAVRNITWFAYASLLLAPAALEASWPAAPGLRRPGFAIRSLACASALALPVTFFVLALLPASTYESRWPASALRAVERVAERDPSARVFASERYADWLLWKKPELAGRVAFDVRFELYSDAELGSIFRYRNRIGADWRRLTRGYDLLVLDRLTDGRLEPSLSGEPGTRRLYRDEAVSVLYRPAG